MDDPDERCVALKGYGKEVDFWAWGRVAAEILAVQEHYGVRIGSPSI